jgi:hypothetical protein
MTIKHSNHVNFSLVHTGCQSVISSITIPTEGKGQIRIIGYSETLRLNAKTTGSVSPPLDAFMFAQLSGPIQTQLIAECDGSTQQIYPVTVSPLYAWDQRRKYAKATAAFALENDQIVSDVVQRAKTTPDPSGIQRPVHEIGELLYEQIKQSFKPCYLYERNIFPPHEQAVRLPKQMKYDVGGTCIDFVLVYAATLYKAGCSPVVMILGEEFGPRHALIGIWTVNWQIESVISATTLSDALNAQAIVPIEVTSLIYGNSYQEAVEEGKKRTNTFSLLWGVDVSAARREGITSLPGRPCETIIGGWEARITDEHTKTGTSDAKNILKGTSVEVIASGHPLDRGKPWEIKGYRARIGRNPHHDEICLHDPTVSNPHGVLFAKDVKVYIEDLYSKNGTFIEGTRIIPQEPRLLEEGQIFQAGDVKLQLCRVTKGN